MIALVLAASIVVTCIRLLLAFCRVQLIAIGIERDDFKPAGFHFSEQLFASGRTRKHVIQVKVRGRSPIGRVELNTLNAQLGLVSSMSLVDKCPNESVTIQIFMNSSRVEFWF